MGKDYKNDEQKILNFEITSDNLRFTDITIPILSFKTISKDFEYINNSKTLSFLLDDYDESIPVFQILLEFFNETGGVF